jgi:hypothetical protein
MSESETVAATQREGSLLIRSAEPADHEVAQMYMNLAPLIAP